MARRSSLGGAAAVIGFTVTVSLAAACAPTSTPASGGGPSAGPSVVSPARGTPSASGSVSPSPSASASASASASPTIDPEVVACVAARESLLAYVDHINNAIGDATDRAKRVHSDSARVEIYRAIQKGLDKDVAGMAKVHHPASVDTAFGDVVTGAKDIAQSNRLYVASWDDRSYSDYLRSKDLLKRGFATLNKGIGLFDAPTACP